MSKKESKDMACYIRQKEGDDLVESGEFAEAQVQRPPEQKTRIPRVSRVSLPFPSTYSTGFEPGDTKQSTPSTQAFKA